MNESVNVRWVIQECKRNALGGAKTPHGVSNPVFRKMEDGSYSIAVFIFLYNAEELRSGVVKRPSRWMLMDPVSGEIREEIDCHERDFCTIPLGTPCELKAEDDTPFSKEYKNQTLAVYDLILKKLRITGKFDKELYDAYMYMMLRMVSVGFKECYRQLGTV